LISLIIRHGAAYVNQTGEQALEFPGLWATTNDEVRKMEEYFLKIKSKHKEI